MNPDQTEREAMAHYLPGLWPGGYPSVEVKMGNTGPAEPGGWGAGSPPARSRVGQSIAG